MTKVEEARRAMLDSLCIVSVTCSPPGVCIDHNKIDTLIAAAREEEREACAQQADACARSYDASNALGMDVDERALFREGATASRVIASAIRARGTR